MSEYVTFENLSRIAAECGLAVRETPNTNNTSQNDFFVYLPDHTACAWQQIVACNIAQAQIPANHMLFTNRLSLADDATSEPGLVISNVATDYGDEFTAQFFTKMRAGFETLPSLFQSSIVRICKELGLSAKKIGLIYDESNPYGHPGHIAVKFSAPKPQTYMDREASLSGSALSTDLNIALAAFEQQFHRLLAEHKLFHTPFKARLASGVGSKSPISQTSIDVYSGALRALHEQGCTSERFNQTITGIEASILSGMQKLGDEYASRRPSGKGHPAILASGTGAGNFGHVH